MLGRISLGIVCAIVQLVSGDNCVVNPDCTCPSFRVDCTLRHGYDLPKFANTTKRIYQVYITGNRNIRRIQEGTFNGLTTNTLSITGTGVSYLKCTVFKGIHEKLTYLYLNDNLLSSIPSCSFQYVRNVAYLYMRNNRLVIIEPRAFYKLMKLYRLELDNNNITGISQGAFRGLARLRYLIISRNQLSVLEGTSFQELDKLWRLDLSHNEISRVHPKAFEGLVSLRTLDLSYNTISALDYTVFQKMFKLSTLDIGHNHISEIHEKTFDGLVTLSDVNIGSNDLKGLPDKLFASSPNIRHLNFFGQKLSLLSTDFFKPIGNVYTLNMSGNRLTELNTDTFRNLSRLNSLDLSANRIESIQVGAFKKLPRLNYVGLNGNLIREIKEAYFVNVSSSVYLDLANNKITLNENTKFPQVRGLSLSSNGLVSSDWQVLPSISSYVSELDLSNNPIGNVPTKLRHAFHIDPEGSIGLKNCSLTSAYFVIPRYGIDLSNNRLENDILLNFTHLRYVYSYQVNLNDNLISSPIPILNSHDDRLHIDTITLSRNYFARVDRFPVFNQAKKHIPCDNDVFIDTLDLSKNHIKFLSTDACLGKVKTLDLSNNQLSIIPELLPRNQSSSGYRIRYLYLTGNLIHQIEPNEPSETDVRGLEIFRNFQNRRYLDYIYLKNNPLHCDCQLSWFRNYTISSKIIGARCTSPPNARGYLLECFSLDQCSPEQRIFNRYTPLEICESDVNIRVTNLTVVTNQNQLNIKWSRFGPGEITGYKVEYAKDNGKSEFRQELVHPRKYETTLNDFFDDVGFNICVSAEFNSNPVGNLVCVSADAKNFSEPAKDITVIALGAALGISLLCLIVLCGVCLVERHRQKSSNVDNPAGDKTLPLTSVTQRTSKAESTSAPNINNGYEENMYEDMREEICGENYEEPVRYTVQK